MDAPSRSTSNEKNLTCGSSASVSMPHASVSAPPSDTSAAWKKTSLRSAFDYSQIESSNSLWKQDDSLIARRVAALEANSKRSLSPLRRFLALLILSRSFELVVSFSLLVNLFLMVMESNLRFSESRHPFVAGIRILLIFWTVEVCTRIFVYRSRFFTTCSNLVDLLLVLTDVVCLCLNAFIDDIKVPAVAFLRIARIVRVVRVLRVVAMFKHFRELYLMMNALVAALRAIAWASFLVGAVLALWSIITVELLNPLVQELAQAGVYDDCDTCAVAFSSAGRVFMVFVKHIFLDVSWSPVVEPLMEAHPWSAAIFIAVVVSINIGLINILLAVIIEGAITATAEDEQRRLHEKGEILEETKSRLLGFCTKMDANGDGTLTLPELVNGYDQYKEFSAAMNILDIHREDMQVVFHAMDKNESGTVSYHEFIEEFYKMRSEGSHRLMIFIQFWFKELRWKLVELLQMLRKDLVKKGASQDDKLDSISDTLCEALKELNTNLTSDFSHVLSNSALLSSSASSGNSLGVKRSHTKKIEPVPHAHQTGGSEPQNQREDRSLGAQWGQTRVFSPSVANTSLPQANHLRGILESNTDVPLSL